MVADDDFREGTAGRSEGEEERYALAVEGLESAVLRACAEQGEWPARIAAGVYAAVDFAIENPGLVRAVGAARTAALGSPSRYERIVGRLVGFVRVEAPAATAVPATTDEALVAGIVGLVGDHVRLGQIERLCELRPELVLLTLLPHLGFEEAKRWADRAAAGSVD